jgi:hypothetical protein
MPTFRPPDIDPALLQEAQQVVQEASAKMESWLNDAFSSVEKEFEKNLSDIQVQLDAQKQAFIEEEQREAQRFMEQLKQLQMATRFLTPLDPDQKAVIEKLNNLVEQAHDDLRKRNERWTNFGSKAVSIAHTGVKALIKSVI